MDAYPSTRFQYSLDILVWCHSCQLSSSLEEGGDRQTKLNIVPRG
jgi:hypothetical protein